MSEVSFTYTAPLEFFNGKHDIIGRFARSSGGKPKPPVREVALKDIQAATDRLRAVSENLPPLRRGVVEGQFKRSVAGRTNYGNISGDPEAERFVEAFHADKPPKVVPRAEFDSAPGTEFHRGVEDAAHADDFRTGDTHWTSGGIYGSGSYFTDDHRIAPEYGDHIVRAKATGATRTIDVDALHQAQAEMRSRLDPSDPMYPATANASNVALALGYHAISVPKYSVMRRGVFNKGEGDFLVVLDRSTMLVSE